MEDQGNVKKLKTASDFFNTYENSVSELEQPPPR